MRGLWAGLRGHVIVICALIGCVAWCAPCYAQPFPSRPITSVVPFAAGGPTDTLARILSERIAAEVHATIVVENVAGASGSIAGARVARATPDGTTITIGHWGTNLILDQSITARDPEATSSVYSKFRGRSMVDAPAHPTDIGRRRTRSNRNARI